MGAAFMFILLFTDVYRSKDIMYIIWEPGIETVVNLVLYKCNPQAYETEEATLNEKCDDLMFYNEQSKFCKC